jgi:hypothetical protein
MRKLTALSVLALALALPASTLASETTSTTSESFTFEAPSISMTVPATVEYSFDGVKFNGWVGLTNIATNNFTGLTIEAKFSVLNKTLVGDEVDPVTIATTNRAFIAGPPYDPEDPTQLIPTQASLAKGDIEDAATWYTIAFADGAENPPVKADWNSSISGVTVPGDYTGTINFKATTNP